MRLLHERARASLFASRSKTNGAIVVMSVAPCTLYLKDERKPSRSFFVRRRLVTSSSQVSEIMFFISSTDMFPFLSASIFSLRYFSKLACDLNFSCKKRFTLMRLRSIYSSRLVGTCCESSTTISSWLKTLRCTIVPKYERRPLVMLLALRGMTPSLVSKS